MHEKNCRGWPNIADDLAGNALRRPSFPFLGKGRSQRWERRSLRQRIMLLAWRRQRCLEISGRNEGERHELGAMRRAVSDAQGGAVEIGLISAVSPLPAGVT